MRRGTEAGRIQPLRVTTAGFYNGKTHPFINRKNGLWQVLILFYFIFKMLFMNIVQNVR